MPQTDITSLSYFFDLSLCLHQELFEDITYPWEALEKIEPYLTRQNLGLIEASVSPNAYLIQPELISIGEGSIVEAGAYIQGPCLIGKNCMIRHGAYIRGNVITGDGCVIGHDSEIKNTILLQEACAAHFAYVGDSILGNCVNLGAGVKCANLRFDKGLIRTHYFNDLVTTKRKKLGAILGDYTQIGCNTVLNPGTVAGQSVRCYPSLNIGGFLPSYSDVKCKTSIEIVERLTCPLQSF